MKLHIPALGRDALIGCFLILPPNLPAQLETRGRVAPPPPVILTVAGTVEVAKGGTTNWVRAQTNQVLTVGDLIRTAQDSRATLRLTDLSLLPIDQLSILEIEAPAAGSTKPSLNLRLGASYLFSRDKPQELQIRTRRAKAAIRGTEFHIRVNEDGRTELTMIDGVVELSNELDSVQLTRGEQGIVEADGPPTKTAVLETIHIIQWALYYPGVLDPDELPLTAEQSQILHNSLAAYRRGNLLQALAEYPGDRLSSSNAERVYRAALLLAVGQVQQTERFLDSLTREKNGSEAIARLAAALRQLIAAVKSLTDPASSSLSPSPHLATELLAESYYQQSRLRLDKALKAARAAVAKSPGFGFAWARVAELEFSFGRIGATRQALEKALELSPENAQALALRGFVSSAENRISEALAYFERAIAIDGALGNAWLGRGLCKIRQGNVAAGRRDLEVAAALEPNRALLRNYLGKAFADLGDFTHATRELDLAKRWDPNEPTSWLYSALLNRDQNRINAAVRDLEKSQDLNDNRSLFRSNFLLDQDRAVRGANLAAIYRDAGMVDVSLREAMRAVNSDYANPSAHLFLANSYNTLRDPRQVSLRYETPTFNELLLANLLAPIGAGSLSQNVSQQEYSRLFERDHAGVSSSTEYFSSGDWITSGSHFGRWGNTAYALDAIHRSQAGQRPNENFSEETFHAIVKQQITPQDSFYLHTIYYDNEAGDLTQYYDQSTAHRRLRIKEAQEPLLLAGFHHQWAPGSRTLFLFGRLVDTFSLRDPEQKELLIGESNPGQFIPLGALNFNLDYRSDLTIYSSELQQIWQQDRHVLVLGGRYQTGRFATRSTLSQPGQLGFAFPDPASADVLSADFHRLSFYGYHYWEIVPTLQLAGGVSYDRLEFPRNFRHPPLSALEQVRERISPKAGLILTPTKATTVRGSYTRSVGGVTLDQSIRLEPTQIGGFNQAYRSLIPESVAGSAAGALFETFGLGIEHDFPTGTYVGVSGEMLNSEVDRTLGAYSFTLAPPASRGEQIHQHLDYQEKTLTVTLNQLLGEDWAFGARYQRSDAELENSSDHFSNSRSQNRAVLHQLNLYALFNHASGVFARAESISTAQSSHEYLPDIPGDNFWQFNLFIGYRFPRRLAEVRLGLLNITDQDYQLNPLNLYAELPRERTLTVSLKLNF